MYDDSTVSDRFMQVKPAKKQTLAIFFLAPTLKLLTAKSKLQKYIGMKCFPKEDMLRKKLEKNFFNLLFLFFLSSRYYRDFFLD